MNKNSARPEIKLNALNLPYSMNGIYQLELFDPVQTHGIYGLQKCNLQIIKERLKEQGATYFRTVKAKSSGLYVLCYKAPLKKTA